ncbi:MAG: c-type cytochrome [Betaproteobacteria bacterium]|nr:c-type cytochrome [Betaproteobacteria bacterium]
MKAMLLVFAAAGVLAAGVGYAQSGTDVVKSKCAACHEADKKKVGPSFKESAAKYKGDKGAQAKVVEKLKEGKGHPKVAASDDELKAAVKQALSTK